MDSPGFTSGIERSFDPTDIALLIFVLQVDNLNVRVRFLVHLDPDMKSMVSTRDCNALGLEEYKGLHNLLSLK